MENDREGNIKLELFGVDLIFLHDLNERLITSYKLIFWSAKRSSVDISVEKNMFWFRPEQVPKDEVI